MASKKNSGWKAAKFHSRLRSRYLEETLEFYSKDEEASFFLMMEIWGAYWTGSRFKRLGIAMENFSENYIANRHRNPVDNTVWLVITRFVEQELADKTMTYDTPPVIRLVALALAHENATATKL